MTQLLPLPPCYTAHLFRPLHCELLTLLRGLSHDEWQRQTMAPKWKVRDVAAHLLDVDLRRLAAGRDGHLPPVAKPPASERELADLVNALNAGGVAFGARLSPRLIVDLLEVSGAWVADLMTALPPHGRAVFAVSWAGEHESEHWMDIGREYTERWHHQMQVRDAAARPLSLLQAPWLGPLLDISVRALPHAYRELSRPAGTTLVLVVEADASAAWTLKRGEHGWQLHAGAHGGSDAVVRLPADAAWRLLYNAPFDRSQVRIEGDAALAAPLLQARSVIVHAP